MPLPNASFSSAILLATIDSLDSPHFLAPIIAGAARSTRDRLIVVLFSRLFNVGHSPRSPVTAARRDSVASVQSDAPALSRTESWDAVQSLLTYVYVQATSVAQNMDKILLNVDVLLRGYDQDLSEAAGEGVEVAFRIEGDSIPVPLPQSIASVRTAWCMPGEQLSAPGTPLTVGDSLPSTYPVVACGGTFDHLHAGHKILLSMTAWIAEEKIIVGVTDDKLLVNKANKDLLESLPERIARVRGFLEFFKPGLIYDVVPIDDVYGPTGWDPNVQALVVSKETLSGGAAVDKRRQEKQLPPLQTFVIDVISHTSHRLDDEDAELLKKTKMSSTFIRQWISANRVAHGVEG
ncbi:Nucleotidylyl transferase [Auriscalpium vulgare]|uniref:Nucleotidylyl transferase n=1 Tax=Auriscalpium vulgare TaxID=40419 RepID=A0ACB8SCI5_9AGAM|nr:Nucleotidylyl transferase [Auriscalpium vulgare]